MVNERGSSPFSATCTRAALAMLSLTTSKIPFAKAIVVICKLSAKRAIDF